MLQGQNPSTTELKVWYNQYVERRIVGSLPPSFPLSIKLRLLFSQQRFANGEKSVTVHIVPTKSSFTPCGGFRSIQGQLKRHRTILYRMAHHRFGQSSFSPRQFQAEVSILPVQPKASNRRLDDRRRASPLHRLVHSLEAIF